MLGFYIGSLRVAPDLSSMSYFRSLTGKTITLVGKISNDPLTTSGKTKLYLDHLYLQTSIEHPNTKDYGNGPPEFSSDSWLPLAGTIYVERSLRLPSNLNAQIFLSLEVVLELVLVPSLQVFIDPSSRTFIVQLLATYSRA